MFKIVPSTVDQDAALNLFVRQMQGQLAIVLSGPCLTRRSALVLCEYLDCVKGRVPGVSRAHLKLAQAALGVYLTSCASDADRAALAASSPAAKAATAPGRAAVLQFPVLRVATYG